MFLHLSCGGSRKRFQEINALRYFETCEQCAAMSLDVIHCEGTITANNGDGNYFAQHLVKQWERGTIRNTRPR